MAMVMEQPTPLEPPAAQAAVSALTLEEALRSLGRVLDAREPTHVYLTIDAVGITVEMPRSDRYRIYPWADLARLSRAQLHYGRSRRARPMGLAAWSLTRWTVLLRVVGQLLDAGRYRDCRIEAAVGDASHEAEVRVTVDGRVVLESLAVQLHWLRLRTRFDGRDTIGQGHHRPWWLWWRHRG
jgi:hypothetical protein